jgi:glutamine synthetase type III
MDQKNVEFNLQVETQKSIGSLQNYVMQLDQAIQMIDANMRQAYGILLQENTRLTVRVNFLLNEMKNGLNEQEQVELEEKFKVFMQSEQEKMQKEVAEAVKAREKEIENIENKKQESRIVRP